MALARQVKSPVMLNAAKHLAAQRNRPFAAAQGDIGGSEWGDTVKHLQLMPIGRNAFRPWWKLAPQAGAMHWALRAAPTD